MSTLSMAMGKVENVFSCHHWCWRETNICICYLCTIMLFYPEDHMVIHTMMVGNNLEREIFTLVAEDKIIVYNYVVATWRFHCKDEDWMLLGKRKNSICRAGTTSGSQDWWKVEVPKELALLTLSCLYIIPVPGVNQDQLHNESVQSRHQFA